MIIADEISKIRAEDGERFSRITSILQAINESGVDVRKLEYIKNKIFGANGEPGLKQISIEDFKVLMENFLKVPQSKTFIVDDMVTAIQEFRNQHSPVSHLTKEMIDDYFTLCHYWPLTVKRDKNASQDMYRVFSSARAKDYKTRKEFSVH